MEKSKLTFSHKVLEVGPLDIVGEVADIHSTFSDRVATCGFTGRTSGAGATTGSIAAGSVAVEGRADIILVIPVVSTIRVWLRVVAGVVAFITALAAQGGLMIKVTADITLTTLFMVGGSAMVGFFRDIVDDIVVGAHQEVFRVVLLVSGV
jgi:hypothetical protein